MINKLRYSLNNKGEVSGCGYNLIFNFEVDKNTPFQSIEESQNYRLVNGVWEWYDYTWTYPEFAVRVTIPQTIILDSDFYSALVSQVKGLISLGYAQQEVIGEDRVMYFNQLQPEHRAYMEQDINVKIEDK